MREPCTIVFREELLSCGAVAAHPGAHPAQGWQRQGRVPAVPWHFLIASLGNTVHGSGFTS